MITALLRAGALALTRVYCGARAIHPPKSGPARIYCANHTSHLDTLLLLAALNQSARPLAAADYWAAGPVRRFWAGRVFRTVFIDRSRRQLNPLAPALQALRDGHSLLVFPEGSRGPGHGTLQPLKPGIFHLARLLPHIDIIPVWIENADRLLPKHARFPLPVSCTVAFGAPLRWHPHEDPTAFLNRVEQGLRSAQRLVPLHGTRPPVHRRRNPVHDL